MINENMDKSNSNTTQNTGFQAEPSGVFTARSSQNVFGNDAYKTFSKSLFDTAKSCHEANNDVDTTQRKLLETFHAQLFRLSEEIDKNKKTNPK